VIAQLEALLCEKLHLLEAPLGLLTVDALVTEEGVAGLGRRQHAEQPLRLPVGVRLDEIEQHPDRTRGIHHKRAVAFEIAELAW